jgi:hypothetical protein
LLTVGALGLNVSFSPNSTAVPPPCTNANSADCSLDDNAVVAVASPKPDPIHTTFAPEKAAPEIVGTPTMVLLGKSVEIIARVDA